MVGMGMDPLLHCVFGPVNQPGMGMGVPDGSAEPSVVIEHRSVVTISASANGNVTFAIVPSIYGCVGIDEGTATFQANSINTTSGSAPFPYVAPVTQTLVQTSETWGSTSALHEHYTLIPFSENIHIAGDITESSFQYGLQPSKYRVLSTMAKVSYVGSAFYNQGASATARLALDFSMDMPSAAPSGLATAAYVIQNGSPIPQILPTSFNQLAALPGARVFPSAQSVQMINAPNCFEYQPIKQAWAPYYTSSVTTTQKDNVFSGWLDDQKTSGGGGYGNDPVGGMGFAPVTFYSATGLSTTSGNVGVFTIETRTCVEYTLAFNSPSARFAQLPPPARPLAIDHVHAIARNLPSSIPSTPGVEEHGWLYNAGAWYLDTMKSIIGKSWRVGAGIASLGTSEMGVNGVLGGIANLGIGGITRNAALPGSQRLAIGM